MLNFDIDSNQYQNTLPFPYAKIDGVLNEDIAKQIQAEILSIDEVEWDRYDNPFEQKYTLRDKYNFPPLLTNLFTYLESDEFVEKLSKVCGYKLYTDETRNFWGVHKYKTGDRLDIHADAGIHPTMKKKKQTKKTKQSNENYTDATDPLSSSFLPAPAPSFLARTSSTHLRIARRSTSRASFTLGGSASFSKKRSTWCPPSGISTTATESSNPSCSRTPPPCHGSSSPLEKTALVSAEGGQEIRLPPQAREA